MTVEKEGFRVSYGQQLFAGEYFGATKEVRYKVLTVKGKEESASVVSFAQVFL